MGVEINRSRYAVALRRYANWRKSRVVWLLLGFFIAGVFLAVLIFGIVNRPRPGEPLITAIEPRHTRPLNLEGEGKGAVQNLLSARRVEATIDVHGGEVAHVVGCAAQRFRADLLVIGRSSDSGLVGRLSANV